MVWFKKWDIDIDDIDVHPKERPGGGKTKKRFTPRKTASSMLDLKKRYMIFMAGGKEPIPAGVKIRFSFTYYTKRKWDPKKRIGDIDNLYKTITDAANGMLWRDDNQITAWGPSSVEYQQPYSRLTIIVEVDA